MEQQKLPNSTLILVFGIISIIGCCFYGTGLILGIIAIFLASKATKLYAENPDHYTGFSNVKTGKILAIIGVILSVIYIIFIVWVIMTFGWDTMQDSELLQEQIKEMMEQ